ncbi:MAG: transcriptional repressor LexA [Actinomycetota bacterium]|nr:transcriptional repressor LexA [Actinomycetota bacterium]
MTTLDGSDLTERQRAILDFIVEAVEARGFPPSVREIGDAVGLSSPSTVHSHLRSLEELGYLKRDPSKPRAIEVKWEKQLGDIEDRPAVRNIPIYGSIAAGPTSLAEQNFDGVLPFPKEFVGDTPHFALTVKGESMIGAGILDGDLVVIRSQPDAANGDIVAAQIIGETGEAEATVKRFRRSGSGIELIPENPNMQPIPVPTDLRILGKVVAVVRRM